MPPGGGRVAAPGVGGHLDTGWRSKSCHRVAVGLRHRVWVHTLTPGGGRVDVGGGQLGVGGVLGDIYSGSSRWYI